MKKVALSIAALFVLAVVSPAFSQPFADVPTDHWAFDAIAELAAKGLVEGYPDGTFKGDRAMTPYDRPPPPPGQHVHYRRPNLCLRHRPLYECDRGRGTASG